MATEPALNPGELPVITSLCRRRGNLREHHYPSHLGGGISSAGCCDFVRKCVRVCVPVCVRVCVCHCMQVLLCAEKLNVWLIQ